MRPKIIHYCWFGPKAIPEKELKCIESWKKFLPEYDFKFWNEKTFDISSNIFASQAYEAGYYAFVSDYVRAKVLFKFGGIYLDTDVEILKGFNELLEGKDNFLGFETKTKIGSAVMSFTPKHNLMKDLLKIYENQFVDKKGQVNTIANVTYLTDLLIKSGLIINGTHQVVSRIDIYPREYFYPKKISYGNFILNKSTVAIHKCSISWMSEREKRRGNNKFWINIMRPLLRNLRSLGVKIMGSENIKTLEVKIRNSLK